ncbi:MAG: hypothetical protein R3D44_14305 [Hyphomicrobiaceae bacterium]
MAMSTIIDRSGSAFELALQSLRDERAKCVARLTAALEANGSGSEVQGWLARIESINASLIRLASAHVGS